MTISLRTWRAAAFAIAVAQLGGSPAPRLLASPASVAVELPARLGDAQFWRLIESLSEPNGYFRSDNLVSNEDTFQFAIPELVRRTKPGGAYLGVGPDQNFTYIVALRPRIAFITDIRRGNLQEHLMYKALIELSADRAEFLSRLFSRKRPAGLGPLSTAAQLFAAFTEVDPSEALYAENLKALTGRLSRQRGSPLTEEDAAGIGYIYRSFFSAGPALSYAHSGGFGGRGAPYPSYQDLQISDDGEGRNRAYLGSEENFQALKALEERNLIVPLVGDFGGPKALRAVGVYLRDHGLTVAAFYTSNVEQYLFGDGIWPAFARNVGTLPLDRDSTFIRSCFVNCASRGASRSVTLLDSMVDLLQDFAAGKILTYWDVLAHTREGGRDLPVRAPGRARR